MDKTYTHKELARELKVSETTIKSYRRKFPGCIRVSSRGKPIRFNADALKVTRKIRDLFERGMSVEEVRLRLSEEFSWVESVKVFPGIELLETNNPDKQGIEEEGGSPPEYDRLGQNESGPQGEGMFLPPSFSNAISGLARSVIALTQQQGEILSRLCGLEESLKISRPVVSEQAGLAEGEDASGLENVSDMPGGNLPEWVGDLSNRLQGMEHSLTRALENLESSLGSIQTGESGGGASQYYTHSPGSARSAGGDSSRVLPWSERSGSAQVRLNNSQIGEEYLRQISTLPLAVQVAGGYTGIAGRGPFCLNDLKAILAQTFSPPHHYAGRWETASGELWYILEQPEDADSDIISLHLRPVTSSRNKPLLEVVRLMLGGASEHPSSLYALVQRLLG